MRILLALTLALPFAFQDDTPTVSEGQSLLQAGDFAGAERVFRAITAKSDSNAQAWMLFGYALHAQKKLDEALAVHEKAATFPQVAATASYNAACVHALKGDAEGALEWLKKAQAAGFQNTAAIATDPDFDKVRDDPRFAQYLPAPLLEGPGLFVEKPRLIHTLVGEAAGDQFGWVARNVGDVDRDGVDDFAATAPTCKRGGGQYSGRVYVYSSKEAKLLYTRDGKPGWGLGNSVAGRADVNGDGTPDVIAGAPSYGTNPGRVLVFSGGDGAVLHELSAGEAGDKFGLKVCGIEDLDGDGCAEVAVGASSADANGKDSGRVYVHSGKDGSELFRIDGSSAGANFGSSADGTESGGHRILAVGAMKDGGVGRCYVYRCTADGTELAFTIDPDATSANLGQYFVSILGDVDGDGVPDVYASDWNNSAGGRNTGRVFVHSGKTGERILTLTGDRPGGGFGTSPSVCGDVNGDGRADLVVGAWQNAAAAPSGGKCYLYSGKDGELLHTWTCKQSGDTFGFDAVGLGDVDGDGAVDFLLTSAWSAAKGAQTGRVFVVAGPAFR